MAAVASSSSSTQRLLLLGPAPAEWVTDSSVVISPLSGYPYQRPCEPAGAAYQAYVSLKVLGVAASVVSTSSDDTDLEDAKIDAELRARYEQKKRARNNTLAAHDTENDYYDLLDLGHLRWRATARQVKDAYRAACLKYHPDKQEGGDDTKFKLVQKANDILSDPEKRRQFDSQDEFDNSIPEASSITPENFYAVLGDAFARNAKWSANTRIPDLGNDSKPYDQVIEFYEFWRNFRSWREFPGEDEYDPENAETREEKRWMVRQNAKAREKWKREERARINSLTDLAFSKDPRIIAHKRAQAAEKDARKAAKQAQRAQRNLEIQLEEEQRLQQIKDEEERIKKEKEEFTKILRKKRARVRQLAAKLRLSSPGVFSEENVEKVTTGGNLIGAAEINTRLTALITLLAEPSTTLEAAESAFEVELSYLRGIMEEVERQRAAAAKAKAVEVPVAVWNPDELSLLAKGLARYPAGVRNRWRLVSELIGTKTEQEVIAKTSEAKTDRPSELRNIDQTSAAFQRFREKTKRPKREAVVDGGISTRAQNLDAVEPWSQDEQDLLERGLVEFYPDDPDRWDSIAELVGTRSKNECIRRFRFLHAFIQRTRSLQSGVE